jgi:CubicO group peptidase (beta-lactamase class C family)
MTISRQDNTATLPARRVRRLVKSVLLAVALIGVVLRGSLRAAESCGASDYEPLKDYIDKSMKLFDVPGLAIAIVKGDTVVYSCGFGVRTKRESKDDRVTADTVFQIGSLTKGFLATTMAIMVDRRKMSWWDRVVRYEPFFQLWDGYVSNEFQMSDLLAQRSGLPEYSGDMVLMLGASEKQTIDSLVNIEPPRNFPRPTPTPTSPSWRRGGSSQSWTA